MEVDVEIINRVKKGNKEAYGIIVKKYMKKVYFMALGLVGDSNDALDLSQTAFIKAYRSLSGFDQKRPFSPWFYAILRNLCLNFIKRKKINLYNPSARRGRIGYPPRQERLPRRYERDCR